MSINVIYQTHLILSRRIEISRLSANTAYQLLALVRFHIWEVISFKNVILHPIQSFTLYCYQRYHLKSKLELSKIRVWNSNTPFVIYIMITCTLIGYKELKMYSTQNNNKKIGYILVHASNSWKVVRCIIKYTGNASLIHTQTVSSGG